MDDDFISPQKVGPYIVCSCLGAEKIESIAQKTIDQSEKSDRIYLRDGKLVSTFLGGEKYLNITCSFESITKISESMLPKFIGSFQARVGKLYHPDRSHEEADEIGEDIDQTIERIHGKVCYKTIAHQIIPGKQYFMIIGMTSSNKKNRNPNHYFAELTDQLNEILIQFSKYSQIKSVKADYII
jgi:hypothetical protein